ncbi:MAG TPA: prepilin-type N-terminal cleavage/methylation domain-containing protein [Candidatus Ozemobacteraceae bacterium]|nr:prepilin-type N-terminal cleavage/methylation domain-containing protein [Candidatus Ozemobacteraceae bacterium]
MNNDNQNMACQSQSTGFSLVELLIAMFILQLIIAPVYLMFTETQKTMFKAADTLTASHLASSLVAGLRDAPVETLRPQPLEEDTKLAAPLDLENLDVLPVPTEFTRKLEIIPVDLAGKEGGPYYLVEVQISWFNRKTSTPVEYIVRDLLRGKK